MEFPIEIQMKINEYAKPMTRPDWKKGCYIYRVIGDIFAYILESRIVIFNVNIDYINQVIIFKYGKIR